MRLLLPLVAALAVLLAACGGGEQDQPPPTAEVSPTAVSPPTAAECEYARTLAGLLDDFERSRVAVGEVLAEPRPRDAAWRNSVASHLATLRATLDAAEELEPPPRLQRATFAWQLAILHFAGLDALADAIDASDVSNIERYELWASFSLGGMQDQARVARERLEAQAGSCPSWTAGTPAPTPSGEWEESPTAS